MSDEQPNEIVAAAKRHEAGKARVAEARTARKSWPIGAIGLGVGIGSAAVAAAMMFAGRRKD